MTGKELKEWASKVSDDAVIEVRERSYGSWEDKFQLQAVLILESQTDVIEERKQAS